MKTSIFFVILNILCLHLSAVDSQFDLVEIKQTDASNSAVPPSLAVDGDEYSCYLSKKSKHNHIGFLFAQKYLVESVQIVIPKEILEIHERVSPVEGEAWVTVHKSDWHYRRCGPFLKFPMSLMNFTCDPPLKGENVIIHVQSKEPHRMVLCEVKVEGIPISEVTNSTSNDTNDKSPVQIALQRLFSFG